MGKDVSVKSKPKTTAKKIVVDGIEFDSKMESEAYRIIKRSGLDFEMQVEFPTMDGFKYTNAIGRTTTMRSAKYTPDFVIEGKHAIEIKGWHLDMKAYQLRKKIFLAKYHEDYTFTEIKDLKVLNEVVIYLLKVKNGEIVDKPKKKRKMIKDE